MEDKSTDSEKSKDFDTLNVNKIAEKKTNTQRDARTDRYL